MKLATQTREELLLRKQQKTRTFTALLKVIFRFILICFIIMLPYNVKSIETTNQTESFGVSGSGSEGIQFKRVLPTADYLKNHFKVQDDSYDIKLSSRVRLQQPNKANDRLIYWKIQKKYQPSGAKKSENCLLINSANILTKMALKNTQNILKLPKFDKAYIIVDANDKTNENKMQQIFGRFQIQKGRIELDSNFNFNSQLKDGCDKLIYIFGNHFLTRQMANRIAVQAQLTPFQSLYFTSSVLKNKQNISLPNLSAIDLSQIQPQKFYSYLYIFDTEFLDLITPLNFGFYTKYTPQNIILFPILALYQSAGRMATSNKILHGYSVEFMQFKQFAIQSPSKQSNSICFISYPTNLYQTSIESALKHLKSLENQQQLDLLDSISIMVYLPYRFNQSAELIELFSYLSTVSQGNQYFRIKIRILSNKISPAYAVYDSVHSYCPKKSLIVTSRHNTIFDSRMVKQLIDAVSAKYHYYYFDVVASYRFMNIPNMNQGASSESKLMHIQVFKSDLFKMIPFWILKCSQIDFYETELPFVRHMMQILNYSFFQVGKTLATVQSRSFSQVQVSQIENIKSYAVYCPLRQQFLLPYQYNSLHNQALRRNAPQKISRLIHQIWLGNSEISRIRHVLFDSIVKVNPNFEVKLWKFDNITQSNFPISYDLIHMVLQKHKQWPRSLYAMVSALMRYEIIVNLGGIYLDYKFEAKKPFDSFLKYELFFIDFQISNVRFGSPKTLGNGVMGGTQNNYHLKLVLTELISEGTYTFQNYDLPWVSGAYKLRKSVTDNELFTQISFGYHLFIAKPYEKVKDFCGGVNRKFDPDQQVFTIKSSLEDQNMTIGYPCKMYPQSYIVMYTPLSGTWVGQKSAAD